MTTLEYLKTALEHAPTSGMESHPDFMGWKTPDPESHFVCAKCSGRIMARGCRLPMKSESVWADQCENELTCELCGSVRAGTAIPGD